MTERFWYLKALSDRWMWILDQLPEPEAEEDYEQCEAIASGDLSSIDGGPVVFKQFNRAKRVGDMVWTTGSMKVASDGFVAALERIGATGWRSFPVEIHLPKGERLTGYQGIASTGVMTLSPPQRKLSKRPKNQVALWDGSEICGMHGRQSWRLIVTDRVLQALREDGADRLEVEEFDRPVVRQQATDGD